MIRYALYHMEQAKSTYDQLIAHGVLEECKRYAELGRFQTCAALSVEEEEDHHGGHKVWAIVKKLIHEGEETSAHTSAYGDGKWAEGFMAFSHQYHEQVRELGWHLLLVLVFSKLSLFCCFVGK